MTSPELPPVPRLPSRAGEEKRRAPRARGLSREAIVEAALAIVDAEGLDALTMRSVAVAMGTGAASLYAHVGGKDELIELVIERVLGECEFGGEVDAGNWQQQAKAGIRTIREVYARHRDLARASFARIPLGVNALRGSEWLITVLRAGGLPDQVVAWGVDLLALYATAIAYEDSLWAREPVAPEQIEAFIASMRHYFAGLPADSFPGIVSMATALTTGGGDDRFEFGLEVLVRGLAAMAVN